MTEPAPLTPIADALDGADVAAPVAGVQAEKERTPPAEKPARPRRTQRARSSDAALALQRLELPEGMPVEPLGMSGGTYFYLDALQQFREFAADKHGRAFIMSLFGSRGDFLFEQWGKRDKNGELTDGFHADVVANALMHACAELGIIDPKESVKGVGAWGDADGGLVLHLGDRVWRDGQYVRPGRYGAHIFPAGAPTPRPAAAAQNADAGAEMLGILDTWHWSHPLLPLLILGWIGQGYVIGALGWRTHVICDGERGSGKSALWDMLKGLYGQWLLATSDPSAASLHQLMAGRAHPIAIDEFEAGNDPKKKAAIVTVLRQASSGGTITRGGDDHVGRKFSVDFAAFLTSIVPVSLQAQDESRMLKVNLLPLDKKEGGAGRKPDLSPTRLGPLGARLMRRMLDQWPRWTVTFDAYRERLETVAGMDARLQDTYGTLLACADLLLYDNLPLARGEDDPGEIDSLCVQLAALVQPQRDEQLADQARCLAHLLQSQVDRGGGVKRSVASWLRQAFELDQLGNPHLENRRDARRALGLVGLRDEEADGKRFLFVVNTHQSLTRIFQDTPWPGAAGAEGSWKTVLRRVEGATVPKAGKSVGGTVQRGTLVPVDGVMDWGEEA